jgi:hypothetical protein
MRSARIDYSGRRPNAPGWSLALLALGTIVCISAVWRLSDLTVRETRVEGDIQRAQAALARQRPAATAPLALAEAKVAAINTAITQLNLPWHPLFQCLEAVKSEDVALLSIEPDGQKRVLRILAEAKHPEDMITFVQSIQAQPQLAAATLIKHETNLQDPNRPIRFLVEAVWKATL